MTSEERIKLEVHMAKMYVIVLGLIALKDAA